MRRRAQTSGRHVTAIAIVCALALCSHVNVVPNDLVWDSAELCLNNPHLSQFSGMLRLLWPPNWEAHRMALRESYRPVALLTFFAEKRLWGAATWGYHLTNALLHTANAAIVYWLGLQLGFGSCASVVAGSVFAVHAVNTEAIAWVSNRSVLLSTGLGLLGLGFFARSFKPGGGKRHIGASVVLVLLGLFASEGIVLLPVFAGVWATCQGHGRRGWRRIVLLLAASAAYMTLRATTTSLGPPPSPMPRGPIPEPRVMLILRTLKTYVTMLVAPLHLNVDRPPAAGSMDALTSGLCLLALAALAYYAIRHSRPLAYGLMLALVVFIPVSNVVFLAGRPMAEQRAYTMAAGVALLAGYLMRGRRLAIATALCTVLTVLAVPRNSAWATEITLWSEAAKVAPAKSRTFLNLGLAEQALGRNRRALAHYSRAVAIFPAYALARLKWAFLLASEGRHSEALEIYQTLPTQEWHPEYWSMVGSSYKAVGRRQEAVAAWETALQVAPHLAHPRAELGRDLLHTGQIERARRLLTEAPTQGSSRSVVLMALAETYVHEGNPKKAAGVYAQAVRLSPEDPATHLGVARVLMRLGDHKRAIFALHAALCIDPYSIEGYRLLGEVLGELGLTEDQQRCERAVERLADDT